MAKTNLFEPKGKFKKDNYFRSRSLQQEGIFFITSLNFSKSREKNLKSIYKKYLTVSK